MSEVGPSSETNLIRSHSFSRHNSDPGQDRSGSFDHDESSKLSDESPNVNDVDIQVRDSPQIPPTPSDEQQPMDEMLANSVLNPRRQSSPTRSSTPTQHYHTAFESSNLNADASSKERTQENGVGSPEVAMDPSPSISTKDSYSRSTAMKGAHELLKKNREQRLKLMEKRKSSRTNLLSSAEKTAVEKKNPVRHPTPVKLNLDPANGENSNEPASPKSPSMTIYKGGADWSRVGSAKKEKLLEREELKKSLNVEDNVSDSSSTWTDATEPVIDQRRALILKMAKNRMKSKQSVTEPSNSDSQD